MKKILLILGILSLGLTGTAHAGFFDNWNLFPKYYQTEGSQNLGAQSALTAFQGGTGTSSPSGILYGDQSIRLKTLIIGSGLNYSGTTLSATGGGSQTPWTSDINANGYSISNLLNISGTSTITISASGVLINNASSTITNLVTLNATSTSATTTALDISSVITLGTTSPILGITSGLSVTNGFLHNMGVLDLTSGTGTSCSKNASSQFGSCSFANVIANSVLTNQSANTGVPTAEATTTFGTTLYGIGTPGQVLMWNGTGVPTWFASSSSSGTQTPWTSDINANGYSISNLLNLSGTSTITLSATGFLVNNASSTIVNLSSTNATTSGATTTALFVSGALNVTNASSSISNLSTINSTSTGATTSALYVINSPVGIGTSLPQQVNANSDLTVAAPDSADIIASSTTNTSSSDAVINAYAPGSRIFMGAHGTNQVSTRYGIVLGGYGEITALNPTGGVTNGLIIGTNNASPLIIGTNNLERLRIDSAGGFMIENASSSIPYLTMINATSTGATTTGLFISGALNVTNASSSITNLNLINSTTTTLYVRDVASFNGASTTISGALSAQAITATAIQGSTLRSTGGIFATGTAMFDSSLRIGGGLFATGTSELDGNVISLGSLKTTGGQYASGTGMISGDFLGGGAIKSTGGLFATGTSFFTGSTAFGSGIYASGTAAIDGKLTAGVISGSIITGTSLLSTGGLFASGTSEFDGNSVHLGSVKVTGGVYATGTAEFDGRLTAGTISATTLLNSSGIFASGTAEIDGKLTAGIVSLTSLTDSGGMFASGTSEFDGLTIHYGGLIVANASSTITNLTMLNGTTTNLFAIGTTTTILGYKNNSALTIVGQNNEAPLVTFASSTSGSISSGTPLVLEQRGYWRYFQTGVPTITNCAPSHNPGFPEGTWVGGNDTTGLFVSGNGSVGNPAVCTLVFSQPLKGSAFGCSVTRNNPTTGIALTCSASSTGITIGSPAASNIPGTSTIQYQIFAYSTTTP